MATEWSPIDPDDIVDLFIDFNTPPGKPFLPASVIPVTCVVTVPDEMTLVTSDIVAGTKVVRVRVGPNGSGTHEVHYHIVADNGEEFDTGAMLLVKERIIGI